ncbi:MAG: MCP four helix bundle domain-containing protein, partial [Betaproteobacteria bacterium]|nr:MCP four helix bundle domain-containing protein [Betaproteobacteria bacterium]
MNRMTIGVRLALGFALIISLLVVSMAISIYRLQAMDDFTESRVPKLATGGKIVEVLLQSSRQMRNVLILDHQDQIKSELAGVQKNRELVRELLARIEALVNDDAERKIFQDIAKARSAYEPLEQTFIDLAAKGDYVTAKDEMLGLLRIVQVKYIGAVDAFIEYQNASSASEARQAQASHRNARIALLALTLIAVAVGVLAAVLITRNLTKSLGGEPAYAADVASAIAEGDLTVEVRTRAGDRTSLLANMARMRDALSESVAEIRMSAEAVGSASGEIAKGNANLSRRTE